MRFPRATHLVAGFENRAEAERFKEELAERLQKFNLELQGEKTRLIEFGRYAAADRARRKAGKPETFNFLGFCHICSKNRKGYFCVLRQTMKKRMQTKLKALKIEMKRRMHLPVRDQGQWLQAVLKGHYQYYGVPRNSPAMGSFRKEVVRLWKRTLERRSQKSNIPWERITLLAKSGYPISYLPTLSESTHTRHDLRQEPSAVNPLARIREGAACKDCPYLDIMFSKGHGLPSDQEY